MGLKLLNKTHIPGIDRLMSALWLYHCTTAQHHKYPQFTERFIVIAVMTLSTHNLFMGKHHNRATSTPSAAWDVRFRSCK